MIKSVHLRNFHPFTILLFTAVMVEPVIAWSQAVGRPVTVADSIGMTAIGTALSAYEDAAPVQFSPNGQFFTVITRKGDVRTNTNEYSLLLFRSSDQSEPVHPNVIATFASSSNRPGITNVRWLRDSQTILFLGARHDEKQQIYSLNVRTRKLRLITRHDTDILTFDATEDLSVIAYLARPPAKEFFNETAKQRGLLVSNQILADLMIGHPTETDVGVGYPMQLFAQRKGKSEKRVVLQGVLQNDLALPECDLVMSPDGRFALAKTLLRLPEPWKKFNIPDIENREEWVFRYVLIDTNTGSSRLLLDAPSLNYRTNAAWSGPRSVILTGTYLPLKADENAEQKIRQSPVFAAEVQVDTGHVTKISEGDFNLVQWDAGTNTVFLAPHSDAAAARGAEATQVVAYSKIGNSWEKVDPDQIRLKLAPELDVVQEQDMNTPPRLVALNHKTHQRRVLLDLNPQFATLKFGRVEDISWTGSDGNRAKGGLYFPVDYVAGKTYPLVIQSHGWDATKFWIDGESTAGYAAQALAGRGFVVAQTGDVGSEDETTPREGPRQTAMFEGLIDYLNGRGLIDRARVGILGWSRTGYHVRYALTFSKYPFAAAVIADGLDASYFQYISWLNFGVKGVDVYERINGGLPQGAAIQSWVSHATGFNLDRVHTPTRLLAFRSDSILNNWEWFAGLRHLGTPVELIWIPDAEHMPIKPWERITAQQGDVDWFCFWLKDEEDHDPEKAEQYTRWREFRSHRQSKHKLN
jgi:dipeptidyl aminopeptidase/acylaminoacyl peptidase